MVLFFMFWEEDEAHMILDAYQLPQWHHSTEKPNISTYYCQFHSGRCHSLVDIVKSTGDALGDIVNVARKEAHWVGWNVSSYRANSCALCTMVSQ